MDVIPLCYSYFQSTSVVNVIRVISEVDYSVWKTSTIVEEAARTISEDLWEKMGRR